MKKTRLILIAILPVLIAACSTMRNPAPVTDRTTGVKTVEASKPGPGPTAPAVPKQPDGRGYYTVRKGDTLLHIALEFGQNYRDLVAWNNLSNPNDIKVDQVLRVLPPEGTAQTGSVTAASGIDVKPLSAPTPMNKSGPRGDKRPYSDTALAELQKPDVTAVTAPATSARTDPAKSGEVRPSDKIADVPGPVVGDDDISWVWPTEGKVVATFSDGKKGIDIAGKLGQPVLAAGAGKVLYAGSMIRGYGNLVIVKHTNNLLSAYAHNKTIFVKEDQTVNKGQKIAEMGNSDTDAVKLHFEIRQQGKPVDPSRFLPTR